MRSVAAYTLLYGSFFLYSAGGIFSKLAGQQKIFSLQFCISYGSVLTILLCYAMLWQQVLKRFPLSVAYANKAVVIPLGMLWGRLIFGEQITWNMAMGVAVIMFGVRLVVQSDGK